MFHFVSHVWNVRNVNDGLLVTLTQRDLDSLAVPAMVDELHDLVLENGSRNLYLDFERVHQIASQVIGKLIALDDRLHRMGGRIILNNLDSSLYELMQAAYVTDTLEIHPSPLQTA
jgi:anti-anti-sigma regulatory factor